MSSGLQSRWQNNWGGVKISFESFIEDASYTCTEPPALTQGTYVQVVHERDMRTRHPRGWVLPWCEIPCSFGVKPKLARLVPSVCNYAY